MTVGVYGLVGGIVKLDDGGLHLSQRSGETAFARMQRGLGGAILAGAPWLMKGLSVAGTAAMFLVGGGILVHGIPPLHHAFERLADGLAELPAVGDTLRLLTLVAFDADRRHHRGRAGARHRDRRPARAHALGAVKVFRRR